MKKPHLSILVVLTLIFTAFTAGFFLGRNQNQGGITVSVPPALQTAPTENIIQETAAAESVPEIVFPININTAGKEEFMALPGIGEVLADRILTYRDSNGGFSAVTDMMNVEGIGEKRMEQMLDLLTIGG